MNAYSEPIAPFHVNAVYLKTPPEPQARKQNGEGNQGGSRSGQLFGNGGDFGWLHLAAVFVFAAVYWLVQRNPALSAITVLVLFACLTLRLDAIRRRIAIAPLSFATLLLVQRMVAHAISTGALEHARVGPQKVDAGLTWVPLFFAVCLFYMPHRPSYSGNFFISGSVLLLASGLLPGDSFLAIFTATQYFVFIALVIVLGVDFLQTSELPQAVQT
jgi:hypothetical protein